MRSTFRILFYVKRDKQKLDGTLPIMCRITVDRQASRFNTKINVKPDLWDAKAGAATGRTREASEINVLLNDIRTSIHNVYHDLLTKENNVNAERIKNVFLGNDMKYQTVLELFQCHNDSIAKLVGITKSKDTYQKYEVARKRMAAFINEFYNASDITLKEVNHMFLQNFEIYLMTTCGCKENTAAKFLQRFRTIIIMAKNNGWIHKDPFANFKIRFKKTDRGYLSQEEIDLIINKEFYTERLEKVRDIFIFSCFTGLAYIDVKNLRQTDIRKSFDGRMWIMSKREKTGVSYNVPLLDIPLQIIKKYDGKQSDDKVLPVMSNQKMNEYLKEIGALCGINKDLTFHLARHSFATLTLTKGVTIESVSKMLGHTNIKTTQIYARITDVKVSADMNSFAEKLETKNSNSNLKLDKLFECLSKNEKMKLFNLPFTLSDDPGRELRISVMWRSLSEEEKRSLWSNTFERDEPTTFIPLKKAAF